jgi:hypothetical protein
MQRILRVTAAVAATAAATVAIATASTTTTSRTSAKASAADFSTQIATARKATAKYATNLRRAKADGYRILTRMIPDMGFHFINPAIKNFNVRRPPILVYEHRAGLWQLAAFEWVFPEKPASPPLPGAHYGSFGAACHYKDGTFVFEAVESKCADKSPETGAAFNLWHPDLVTLHLWLWYPNPGGIFDSTNPFVTPFNKG